jgi:catalase
MIRNLASFTILAAVIAASAHAQSADLNTQIVDALNKRYGVHPGFRANHAKGIVAEGTFMPSPHAAALSSSPLFEVSAPIPIIVRFSDAGGLPNLPDGSPPANPHGMAIKFRLPSSAETDIVVNALKFFTVATPEDFRDLQLAAATSPPGQPMSAQFKEFLERHPSVEKANATLGIPRSFAEEQYYGVDAFIFIDRAGHRQPFRYIISPEKIVHLSKGDAAKQSSDYLVQELPQRLAKGTVTFHLGAQLAAPGDQTKDPTQAWPDDRKVVDMGTLTIAKAVADSLEAEKKLLFLPGRLTSGIEASDDPLIRARDGSYAVSYGRRIKAP